MTGYDRDLIGYADEPPDPKWPDGAGFALSFVMNYEEGSEPSMQDGEGRTETGPTEAGERLFTFVRYPPEQWRSSRTRMLLY